MSTVSSIHTPNSVLTEIYLYLISTLSFTTENKYLSKALPKFTRLWSISPHQILLDKTKSNVSELHDTDEESIFRVLKP